MRAASGIHSDKVYSDSLVLLGMLTDVREKKQKSYIMGILWHVKDVSWCTLSVFGHISYLSYPCWLRTSRLQCCFEIYTSAAPFAQLAPVQPSQAHKHTCIHCQLVRHFFFSSVKSFGGFLSPVASITDFDKFLVPRQTTAIILALQISWTPPLSFSLTRLQGEKPAASYLFPTSGHLSTGLSKASI